jgi:hypothetical protein
MSVLHKVVLPEFSGPRTSMCGGFAGHFGDSIHPTEPHLLLPMTRHASARKVYLQTGSGPWLSPPRCTLLQVLHRRKERKGKALKRWLGFKRETHLQCASTVGVDNSFTLSSEQICYPGGEFGSKTLSIPIYELMDADSSVDAC